MDPRTLGFAAIALYLVVTGGLAVRAWRRTRSVEAFAVGGGRIPAALVGLSLAAQLTSVATFVVNPGLIFAYGVSGILGFGVAAAAGITLGLLVFSHAFRRVGKRVTALTVPGWIGARWGSRPFALLFAFLSLGLVAYAVLIVVALAWVLHVLLGISPELLALGLVAFVFTSVALGGVNAHAWTNAVQAGVMLVVALLLVGAGLPALTGTPGLFARLAAQDPALVAAVNPASPYFRTVLEVFGCNFLVGLALVCQPHILSKALYVADDRGVRRTLLVAILAGTVFSMVLLVGLYARLDLPAATPVDQVVPLWIGARFSPATQVLVTLGVLCAGISTLEGIVLALSAIASVDVFLPLAGPRWLGHLDAEARGRLALRAGRVAVAALGGVAVLLSWHQIRNPTGGSVAIFAQYGVYALTTASFVPLAAGMFLPTLDRRAVVTGTLVAVAAYLGTALFEFTRFSNNPAFLATCGILAGWAATAGVALVLRLRAAYRVTAPAR